ncbi:MAG: glycerol acyltransferase [Bacteroidota bacterium]
MIIKGKPLPPFFLKFAGYIISLFLKRRFNKLLFRKIDIKAGHSYLLMCNHFSFLDGFLAYYLCNQIFMGNQTMKHLHIMSLKKQLQRNKWLKLFGSFSIEPGKRSITESFAYAGEILSKPGNLLLFYPQGNLESIYARTILFEDGINEIVPKINGHCQLIWCSNLIDYFESTKPTVEFNLLDCGTNQDYDFEQLSKKVNDFHRKAMDGHLRFTPTAEQIV